jgi:hypothetical protein
MGTIKTTNIQSISGSGTVTLGTSGETFTVPSGVTVNMSSATQTGVGGNNTPSFKATLSGNQVIGNNTFTKAALATEVWDTDSAWDTSNYRFTVPSGEGGKYVFTARFLFYYLANEDIFEARFYKNGSSLGGSTFRETGSTSSAAQQVDNSSTIVVNLSAGDYIELFVKHNEGGNQTLYGPGNGDTYLAGYKLIGI